MSLPKRIYSATDVIGKGHSMNDFENENTECVSNRCGNVDNNPKIAVSKNIILNEVLKSPWCPRLPYYYKPFRKKCNDQRQFDISNDKNNNIDDVLSPVNVGEAKPLEKAKNIELMELLETSRTLFQSIEKELKCKTCDQVFIGNEALTKHVRLHSSATRYTCGDCYKTFSQLRNFKYHMSVHRGTKEFATTCPICSKYFNDRGYLSSHMKIHRNKKEYKCAFCPKSFNQRVAYNMHVRIHTGVKPHVCVECGKAFSRKMLLKQHFRTHSGERPYACSHCDKHFADRSNMILHLRLHTGIKPYSCSLCPKSFTKKHHLKSHLNIHTGAKPYSCPRCKLAFTQSSNMRTHYKKCKAPEGLIPAAKF